MRFKRTPPPPPLDHPKLGPAVLNIEYGSWFYKLPLGHGLYQHIWADEIAQYEAIIDRHLEEERIRKENNQDRIVAIIAPALVNNQGADPAVAARAVAAALLRSGLHPEAHDRLRQRLYETQQAINAIRRP